MVHGVRDQLTALTDIPHVKGHRARLLYEAGLRSPELIASAKLDHLAAIIAKGALKRTVWAKQASTVHVTGSYRIDLKARRRSSWGGVPRAGSYAVNIAA